MPLNEVVSLLFDQAIVAASCAPADACHVQTLPPVRHFGMPIPNTRHNTLLATANNADTCAAALRENRKE